MLWLFDQYLEGVYACEDGGVTKRVIDTPINHPSLHLLYLLAGMVLSHEREQIEDLRNHIDTPDYFRVRFKHHSAIGSMLQYSSSIGTYPARGSSVTVQDAFQKGVQ